MSIARFHSRFLEQAAVEIAPAEAVIAGLAAAVLLGDDLDAEPDQRAHVGGDEAVGADDVDHAPARRQRDADLGDARIAGTRRGVDLLAQRDLLGERDQAAADRRRRTSPGWCAAAARQRAPLRGIEQLEGRGGALDRRFADLVGVGEGGGLAGHAAQAEARRGVIIGGLQPAVVEAERLARAILEIELAIVVRARCVAASRRAPSGSRLR